jgi:hypothetical protein
MLTIETKQVRKRLFLPCWIWWVVVLSSFFWLWCCCKMGLHNNNVGFCWFLCGGFNDIHGFLLNLGLANVFGCVWFCVRIEMVSAIYVWFWVWHELDPQPNCASPCR